MGWVMLPCQKSDVFGDDFHYRSKILRAEKSKVRPNRGYKFDTGNRNNLSRAAQAWFLPDDFEGETNQVKDDMGI